MGGSLAAAIRGRLTLKLAVAFVVIVALVVAIGANTYLGTRAETGASTEDTLRRTAELQSETLRQWVGSMRQESVTVSSREPLAAREPDTVSDYLDTELDSRRISDEVATLHLLAPRDGTLTVTSSSSPGFVGLQPRVEGVPWVRDLAFENPDGTLVTDAFRNPKGATGHAGSVRPRQLYVF